MKVKTLLNTIKHSQYCLQDRTGWTLEEDYIGSKHHGSEYDDWKVLEIFTTSYDTIFIKIG